ncbi:MAG: hypothetical protein WA102_10605 [Candidatus Methanoperedens sp.]
MILFLGRYQIVPVLLLLGKRFLSARTLKSALEGWLMVKIRHGDVLPVIDGLDINQGIPSGNEATAHA